LDNTLAKLNEELQQLRRNKDAEIRRIQRGYRDTQRKLTMLIPKRYTTGEEICNSVTHGIGAGLSIVALVLLIIRAVLSAPAGRLGYYVTGYTLFGATLVILYLMSTLYHALTPYDAKKLFAVFDHSSIYLLIAGTYTPFCLTTLNGALGWTIFGIIWLCAVLGITFYAIFGSRIRALSVATYIPMGWIIVAAAKPLYRLLPRLSLLFLLLGGIAYTVGCVFYALKKIKWMHGVWHLFVLAGSVFHFFSVYLSTR
jgi:hemolysin III